MPKLRQNLKDHFVPHEGNDHLPHALKPKRLVFHVAGALMVKVLVVVFISLYPLRAWLSPDLAMQEAKKIIVMTNQLRQSLNLGTLTENTKLDQAAADKVSDMLLNQYFAHVSPTGLNLQTWVGKVGYAFAIAGENLAMGFNTAPDVMTAWENSPTHYANLVDPNYKDIGVAMDTGAYQGTQTAFIAQYFGRPSQELAAATASIKKIVLPPKATTLTLKGPVASADKVLNVAVKLPEQTTKATAIVNNLTVPLTQGSDNTWQGNTLVGKADEKALSNPVVPASVQVTGADGTTALAALDWDNIQPQNVGPYDQYLLFRQNPAPGMQLVLRLSNIYFLLLLALIVIALANFIIFRKKQHHRVLFTSLGAAMVVLLLIIT